MHNYFLIFQKTYYTDIMFRLQAIFMILILNGQGIVVLAHVVFLNQKAVNKR